MDRIKDNEYEILSQQDSLSERVARSRGRGPPIGRREETLVHLIDSLSGGIRSLLTAITTPVDCNFGGRAEIAAEVRWERKSFRDRAGCL